MFTNIRLSLELTQRRSQAAMRRNRNLGVFLTPVLFLAGAYLLEESNEHSEWYMDIYLIAGAIILATSLIVVGGVVRRYLSIRRMEQHVRGDE